MATGRIGVTPVLGTRWSKEPTGGTTSLSGLDDNSVSLVYSVGYEQVYRNGVLLSRGNDYTATDGTSITLTDATITGDIIEVFAQELVPLTDAISKGQFTAKGSILSASAASTPAVLAVGTNEHRLVADSGETSGLKYVADTTNYAVAAKGDLLVGTAADTLSALSVGTNDYVLTADSAEATGLKWAAASSAGSMTLINTGGTALTGTSVSVSSIPSTYKMLYVYVDDYSGASSGGGAVWFRFNSSTSGYSYQVTRYHGSTASAGNSSASSFVLNNGWGLNDAANDQSFFLMLPNYASSTSYKIGHCYSLTNDGSNWGTAMYAVGWQDTTAINEVKIELQSPGTFDSGTIYVYGVN